VDYRSLFYSANVPAAVQRLLDSVLAVLTLECLLLFPDDILAFSKSFERQDFAG
jgi:hypothetical protein